MDTKILLAMVMLLFVVLFVGAKAQSAAPPVSPHDEDWGWCITSAGDKPVCDEMIKILEGLDPEKSHKYSCVVGEGPEDCMKKISAGEAKIGVFDGGNIRKASSKYQLKPVRLEITGTSTDKYYSVGIVKSRNCPRNLGSLRGKRSCHSGYGRSAGWTIPLTFLVNNNIMPVITSGPSSNDIQSLKYFFLKSCAPTNDNTKAICSACKNTTRCTQEDEYYDYHGAFRGLVED
ncbi:hypothetical protein MPTK1_5g14910 [Marchantia polymorpha subsp. ruderalis]|uniref:Transferrin-like domain-containing protein n=2 Tax=Marchantia polymorpha TaxID=3197 RepID=A0AAF6BIH3_MARPO|nr:hypothetical protein MARPO_0229s0003 [Marchantia polymorpha]PTQ35517.1 hypothetical protein MARPO_0071s0118 [Marchantia polymorpha]BBN11807.1 hypothetical protein Mp_5g14910 [Marchantia polymorpha subsp. ruderalis]|eukprot:PTQ27056.1 hypothetical protein MARPO_0229s0003 [Marchantia polymorpha]